MTDPVFTVFTPTYNRGDKIHRVYNSLKHQTFKDFEWLIVDDGSTDNTKDLIAYWRNVADFPIRYIYQSNQGKHNAINRGVQAASGELFLIFDSDDECVEDALATFYDYWLNIEPNQRQSFAGITALCQNTQGQIVGDQFPQNKLDTSPQELTYYYGIEGEKWGFQRTAVLQQFPFPETIENGYLPESCVWHSIGKDYKTRCINKVLRIYHQEDEGLSVAKNIYKLSSGLRLMNLSYINNDLPNWFFYKPIGFIFTCACYGRYSLHKKQGFITQAKNITNQSGRFLWLISLPLATALFIRDRLTKKN